MNLNKTWPRSGTAREKPKELQSKSHLSNHKGRQNTDNGHGTEHHADFQYLNRLGDSKAW